MSRIARDLAAGPHNESLKQETESSSSPSMQRFMHGKMPHVAVVGAGFAGLRAADVLIRSGARVTIFEARDRVGGRVQQQKSGGYIVDMGSNWIHGTKNNPIARLAQKTGTPIMEPEERHIIFDPEGKSKSEKASGELAEEVWSTIVKALQYSDEKSADIDKNVSLMDYFRQKIPEKYPDNSKKVDEIVTEARMFGPFVGEPIERQSLKFFFLEECLEGENVFMAGSYKKVLEEVSRIAIERAEIKYKAEVTNVRYRDEDDERPVSVQTQAGDTYDFDEVIVTCPLGWLKLNHSKMFTPPLPARLSEAIQSIGYGRLEKLYISFPSAFWLDKMGSPGGPQNGYQGSFSYPCFTNFQQPNYHPFPESKDCLSWNQSLVSLAHLPESTAHPTLLFYMYGDCGAHVTRLLEPHTPHSPMYNQLLDDFALPFYSRLPNYDSSNQNCIPTSYLQTSWQLDPYAGYGSYSNFQIGLERGDEDIEVMRSAGGLSAAGRGLWLAGEHTAPFVAVGTTTGAWWSGQGVARRIANRYGLKVEEDDLDKTAIEAPQESENIGYRTPMEVPKDLR